MGCGKCIFTVLAFIMPLAFEGQVSIFLGKEIGSSHVLTEGRNFCNLFLFPTLSMSLLLWLTHNIFIALCDN